MPLLSARGLSLSLPDRAARTVFGPRPMVEIFKDVDLELKAGESLGIVGESGSGKTSFGRTLLRLYRPTAGRLSFEDTEIGSAPERELRPLRARMQMIFQDSLSSLNPRHRVEDILAQPLLAFERVSDRNEGRRTALKLLEQVGLPTEFARRYPHELSGGQRQRVGIARAIALKPKLMVADEDRLRTRRLHAGADSSSAQGAQAPGFADLHQPRSVGGARALRSRAGDAPRARGRVRNVRAGVPRAAARVHPGAAGGDSVARSRSGLVGGLSGLRTRQNTRNSKLGTLEGKVAIITGAGSGIGHACADLFAQQGSRLLLAGRREAPLQELTRALGESIASYVTVDVSEHADNQRMFDEATRRFGGFDIFIANAGLEGASELIEDYPMEVFDEVMAVNVRGVFLGLKYAMPMMRARGGGSIVIVSSIAGIKARNTHNSAYVASKHAQVGLMRTAALEGASHGIRVNAVIPGPTQTEMVRRIEESRSPGAPERTRAAILAQLPLKRYGTAEEVAQVIAFVASDVASISTGGVFAADGGLSAI